MRKVRGSRCKNCSPEGVAQIPINFAVGKLVEGEDWKDGAKIEPAYPVAKLKSVMILHPESAD